MLFDKTSQHQGSPGLLVRFFLNSRTATMAHVTSRHIRRTRRAASGQTSRRRPITDRDLRTDSSAGETDGTATHHPFPAWRDCVFLRARNFGLRSVACAGQVTSGTLGYFDVFYLALGNLLPAFRKNCIRVGPAESVLPAVLPWPGKTGGPHSAGRTAAKPSTPVSTGRCSQFSLIVSLVRRAVDTGRPRRVQSQPWLHERPGKAS
jgi:hypothetical protein